MKLLNKNIALAFIFAAFYSCNPLEDTYEELEKSATIDGPEAPVTYTFTSDEYEALADVIRAKGTVEDSVKADFVEDNEVVTNDVEVSGYLEEFVAVKYPQFGVGTAVLVTYNYMDAPVPDYSMYLDAPEYELTEDDYASVNSDVEDAGFFYPSEPAADYLPGILTASVQSAIDGDVYAVSYMASTEDAVLDYSSAGDQTIYTDDLNEGVSNDPVDGYFAQSVSGDQSWVWRAFSDDGYAYMSGFSGGAVPNEDWLVLEDIDLSSHSAATLKLYQAANYLGSGVFGTDLAIKVSTDFDGADVTAATWTDVVPDVWPSGSNWDFVTSSLDLTPFAGQNIDIAFYYHSTADFAAAWELSDITITVPGSGPSLTSKAPVKHIDYYAFNDSEWEKVTYAYTLNAYDYNSMGEASGQPGRFDNFSDDAPAEAYIPKLLSMKFDFPIEGDEYLMVYKFYNGDFTETRATPYTFLSGSWVGSYLDMTTKTDQLKRNATGWVFDPSVEFTMVSADYQMIVDVVKGTHPDLVDDFGTGEFYYGAGAYYENFDLGYTSRWSGDYEQAEYVGLSGAEQEALIIQRMAEGKQVLLEQKYPQASLVEGVQVTYTVNAASYDGTDGEWVTVFELTGVGQFELLEDPTKK